VLPDITRAKVESKLHELCDRRVPPQLRDRVRLGFKIDGNKVLLLEERPAFPEKTRWVEIPVAKFSYTAKSATWQLYCRDRNSKWHRFTPEPATPNFDRLVAAVDTDPTGIFWG
jgi:hypothetical protein